jgi:hypothetical protein
MPEKIAARRKPVDERIPPELEPMQEKKAARYNPSDRRIRPQAGLIHHHVHIHEIHANDERMHHYQRRRTSITGLGL